MNEKTRRNLKGLAEIVGLTAMMIIGGTLFVKGCIAFDDWHMKYVRKIEEERYKERVQKYPELYPRSSYLNEEERK
ncbi:hypothetical protein FJZ19_03315 [Candidatus Pacearchaeota archaeon]|nr:hypothetical protein [Candidatus Pacearchaeota archaeon]